MRFKTDFTAEDYIELCWFQTKVASIFMSAGLALALGLTLTGLAHNIIIGVLATAIAYPIISHFRKRGVTKRAERRFAAFGASSELSLVLNENEILQNSNSGETRLPWEDVYAVRESENSYYVFLTKNKAFYFPKRSFESEAHKEEFLTYINKYVPEKKIKLKKSK